MKIKYYSELKLIKSTFRTLKVDDEAVITAALFHRYGESSTSDPEDIAKEIQADILRTTDLTATMREMSEDLPSTVSKLSYGAFAVMTDILGTDISVRCNFADMLWVSLVCVAETLNDKDPRKPKLVELIKDIYHYSADILQWEIAPELTECVNHTQYRERSFLNDNE
ncbi:MAG: hypothetical protein J6Y02_14590 [Pseudobutyrivibrio sp.]|nr:hypothetical protein [Pseudobutyrivibrio sp.]